MVSPGTELTHAQIIEAIMSCTNLPIQERVKAIWQYAQMHGVHPSELTSFSPTSTVTLTGASKEIPRLAETVGASGLPLTSLHFPWRGPVDELSYLVEAAAASGVPPTSSSSGEDADMSGPDWMARYLDKLDREIAGIKNQFAEYESRMVSRIDQFLGEMRNLDNHRREDIALLKKEIKDEIKEIKQDFAEVKKSTDATTKWVIGLILTVIFGIGTLLLRK